MDTSTNPRRHFPAVGCWVIAVAVLIAGSRLGAQQDRTFGEEKRITAIDLVLGFQAGAVREWATDTMPSDLGADDFTILFDGKPRPVVALESGDGPWQLVLYFDAALASSAGLRWAAATLAGRSDELTALGEVTIVVADPAPRTLLPPTRDREQLNASLSQLARFQEGRDELLSLRAQVAKDYAATTPLTEKPSTAPIEAESGGEPVVGPELLLAAAVEEARIVCSRHDDLLLELVERGTEGPYRALLLASGGYDLRPGDFYRSLATDPAAGTPAAGTPADDLGAATESLARTLAAYGWVVLPMLPAEVDPLQEGVRIGKLRLTGPSVEVEDRRADWQDYDRTVVWLFGGRLEGRRKPKRAEAYLELGSALQVQGKLGDAEDALRQAIYHFAGDPKTAGRQAVAFARLGAVLEARDQAQEANAALSLARRLDPSVEIAGDGKVAGLLAPLAPLETLAGTTAGAVVQTGRDLASALEGLRRRRALSYQVAGPPDGELHTLEARFEGSRRLVYPGWARSSVPESVAAARVRRLLAGEPTGGSLALSADFVTASGLGDSRRGEVRLALEPPTAAAGGDPASETVLRLSLGTGGPDVEPRVEHRRLGLQTGRDAWSYQIAFEMPEDRSWLAVLVEDLETGAWGGRLIEVP